MKRFFKWIIKNLSNVLGVIGILLTLYFGVFYVPNWLKEIQLEKSINAHRDLMQSLKELVYSDSTCAYPVIVNLIQAKELELNQAYPYTPGEILTQVQESFMQDRFLPLAKRRELMTELDILKQQIPRESTQHETQTQGQVSIEIWQWASIIFTILIVVFGLISFYQKYRIEKEKDEEIESQITEVDEQKLVSELAFDYEKQIINVIKSYPGIEIRRMPGDIDWGFDLEFDFKGNTYFIETKYLAKSKVGLNSFQGFLARQKGLQGKFFFIYNTDVTEMVRRRTREFNKLVHPEREIILVRAENGADFKRQLEKLLSAT